MTRYDIKPLEFTERKAEEGDVIVTAKSLVNIPSLLSVEFEIGREEDGTYRAVMYNKSRTAAFMWKDEDYNHITRYNFDSYQSAYDYLNSNYIKSMQTLLNGVMSSLVSEGIVECEMNGGSIYSNMWYELKAVIDQFIDSYESGDMMSMAESIHGKNCCVKILEAMNNIKDKLIREAEGDNDED